jgi:hypothetical protein
LRTATITFSALAAAASAEHRRLQQEGKERRPPLKCYVQE